METLQRDVTAAVAYLPHLVGALVILLVGYVVARVVGRLIEALLRGVGIDRLTERTRLADDLAAVGLPAQASRLLGRLAFAILLVAALVQAVDALELAPLSQALRQLLEFTPHLILAALILLGGAMGGDLLGRAATAAMGRAGLLYHTLVGTLIWALVLLLALLLALQQLTIEATFLLAVLLVALGGVALGAAIAFGWGARMLAENVVSARYVEQNFQVGDAVAVAGVAGTIAETSATSVTLRTPQGGKVVIPNGVLARTVVAPALPQEVASNPAGQDA